MDSLTDHDLQQVRQDISQAFRLTDKWLHEDRLNSAAYENIIQARGLLQKVLENLTLTEAEIEQHEIEEGETLEERWEEEQAQLRYDIDTILDSFKQCTFPYKMSHSDAHVIGKALPSCISNVEISKETAEIIAALLNKF